MIIAQNYKNAFTEVYEILNLLEEEEYKKIPQNLIDIIAINRNNEYKYQINKGLKLWEQSMLTETKAILYNIFRDYLSTQNQKKKIIEMQNKERERIEEIKKAKYNVNNIFKHKNDNTNIVYYNDVETSTTLIKIRKECFIKKLLNKIKDIFKLLLRG